MMIGVSAEEANQSPSYDFIVKTKQLNYQWTQPDVVQTSPRRGTLDLQEIGDSFAGKLLIHTVRFGASCRSVVLQTNIQFHDHACEISDALRTGKHDHKYAKPLFEKFGEIFSRRQRIG